MESLRHRFETIAADGGETSNSMQSAQRQTALAEPWPSEEVGRVEGRACGARCRGGKKRTGISGGGRCGDKADDDIAPVYTR